MNPIVWDCETLHLSSDLAPNGEPIGWSLSRRHLMQLGLAVTWSRADGFIVWVGDGFPPVPGYDIRHYDGLPAHLESGDLVVDYSNNDFDQLTVSACLGVTLKLKQHVDLLRSIVEAQDRLYGKGKLKWPNLDELGRATIRRGKNGKGDAAPTKLRQAYAGDLDAARESIEYCLQDVDTLRGVTVHVAHNGYVVHPERLVIPVSVPGGVSPLKKIEYSRNDRWQHDKHTPGQVRYIRTLLQNPQWQPMPEATKGQLSKMIEQLKQEQRQGQHEQTESRV